MFEHLFPASWGRLWNLKKDHWVGYSGFKVWSHHVFSRLPGCGFNVTNQAPAPTATPCLLNQTLPFKLVLTLGSQLVALFREVCSHAG